MCYNASIYGSCCNTCNARAFDTPGTICKGKVVLNSNWFALVACTIFFLIATLYTSTSHNDTRGDILVAFELLGILVKEIKH